MEQVRTSTRTLVMIGGGLILVSAASCLIAFLLGAALSYAILKPQLARAEAMAMHLEAQLAQAREQAGRPMAFPPRSANAVVPPGFDPIERPPASIRRGDLININFAGEGRRGTAAIGRGESDFWNRYHFPWVMRATMEDLKTIEGRPTGALLQTHTLTGEWGWTCPDPMWGTFSYSETDEGALRFPNLPSGVYNLYVFAHGAGDPNPEKAWVNFSRTRVDVSGRDHGVLATEASEEFLSLDWKRGIHYVVFEDVEIREGGVLNITLLRGGENAKPCINGLQLERIR
jgi:hypothetical protein